MRKLLTGCAIAVGLSLWGAPGYATQFTVGAFGGASRTSLNGDAPPGGSYHSVNEPVSGLEGGISIRPDVMLLIAPGYLRRGTVLKFQDSQKQKTGPDVDLRLEYLEIPVAVRFTGTSNIKPYALGGFSLDVMMDAEIQVEGEPAEDITNDVEKVEVSLLFGAGALFPVGRFVLFTELRYVQGLQNLTVPGVDQSDPRVDVRLKNAGTQLLAGILLPIGTP